MKGGGALVGRAPERATLERILGSREAELVAVTGRRRVGKTFLVREALRDRIAFELTGSHRAPLSAQLGAFDAAMRASFPGDHGRATSWPDAFERLRAALARGRRGDKRVLFVDELPWLAARRSGFLPAFEHFWNAWAVTQRDLVVVVCGSAASFMSRELLHARGGLHNRVTRHLRLAPFTVAEADAYLRSRGVELGRYQTLELYAALGGVPHYLRLVERGESAAAAIDRLCFARGGELRDEFGKLYASLFEHHERHVALVRALGAAPRGLGRGELAARAGFGSGGTVTRTLDDLEECGFVLRTPQLGHAVRDAVYRLADELSLFHLRWIEPHRGQGSSVWQKRRGTPAWRAWSGYAFEAICHKHVTRIKRALGIEAVETTESSWRHRPADDDDRGAEVDLVIDRRDETVNLCEMKFCEGDFVIDKRYAAELQAKRDTFRRVTKTHKALFTTLVTTHGVAEGRHARDVVDAQVTADALFD